MKVALYVRVSTGKQAEKNLSIPDQLKQLEDYCKLRGDEIYKEYIEEGASATDDKRAVFLEMIDDAMQKEPPFSLILVLTTSRFFRDAYLAKFYKKSYKNGVSKSRLSIRKFRKTTQASSSKASSNSLMSMSPK